MNLFIFRFFVIFSLAFGGFSTAHAQSTASASFGVTVILRTFSEEVTADHRCIGRAQPEGQRDTFRISCPATVDVQTIARASTTQTGQTTRLNSKLTDSRNMQVAMNGNQALQSSGPVELLISW